MTRYAVQCLVATYDMAVVIVEADTLDADCAAGIEQARTQGKWDGLDIYGPIFVDGIAATPGDDPLDDIYNIPINVSPNYAESGQP